MQAGAFNYRRPIQPTDRAAVRNIKTDPATNRETDRFIGRGTVRRSCQPSEEVVLVRVLVVQLHVQLLSRGLVDHELRTDRDPGHGGGGFRGLRGHAQRKLFKQQCA